MLGDMGREKGTKRNEVPFPRPVPCPKWVLINQGIPVDPGQ